MNIQINTDNAAFEDKNFELARILRELADKIENGQEEGSLFDYNGNKVGGFK